MMFHMNRTILYKSALRVKYCYLYPSSGDFIHYSAALSYLFILIHKVQVMVQIALLVIVIQRLFGNKNK